jgi:Transposase DDE domain group 1
LFREGFHPLGAWLANTAESLAMLLRPGNAGSNTVADHIEVLAAAIAQVPARFRSRLLVRAGGAGASHELIGHLLSLARPRRTVLFTCGWMITPADEDAIRMLPASAWQAGLDQDGTVQDDKHVTEITQLMSRAAGWPAGLRWIVRRTKPSRRHAGNLTAYEKATGWRYSIICTSIPATGIPGVPGSRHPQYIDVVHRQHAVVEDGVRNGKAMGLRNLPRRGWSTAAGSLPRASPPTWRHGHASSAFTARTGWRTQSRPRSATGCGTSPPESSATPASAS